MTTIADIASRVLAHRASFNGPGPYIVGVAGPPASGKSTGAERLAAHLADQGFVACPLQMDGFHMQNADLDALGIRAFKGRIDTFDSGAFHARLARVKARDLPLWWPTYSRESHSPVAEGTYVTADVEIVVLEGNYILFDQPVWRDIAGMLDFSIYIDQPDEVLFERLLDRHMTGGRDRAAAILKAEETDLPNARFIRDISMAADLRFEGGIAL